MFVEETVGIDHKTSRTGENELKVPLSLKWLMNIQLVCKLIQAVYINNFPG